MLSQQRQINYNYPIGQQTELQYLLGKKIILK
jgi:hypothetical protein